MITIENATKTIEAVTPMTDAKPEAPKPAAKQVVKKASAAPKTVRKSPVKAPAKPVAKSPSKPAVKGIAKAPVKVAAKALPKTQIKPAKPAKEKKPKLVRDSFTIPKVEYLVLEDLKHRAGKLSTQIKKSELLRAGIMALAAMPDASFVSALKLVPTIKTGRPAKS